MANEERIKFRISSLLQARQKCLAKLEAHPADPRSSIWQKKLKEFDQSLANFQEYGQEAAPTKNPVSVEINVPKGEFSVKAYTPEG